LANSTAVARPMPAEAPVMTMRTALTVQAPFPNSNQRHPSKQNE
jgi:hypothetical protein